MLRAFFSSHNPLFYPALLLMVVALRWPGLDAASATTTEGLLWAAAERMADGHAIYRDVWVALPPVLPSIYALAVGLVGPAAWLALQLLAICLVMASAYLLNSIAATYRFYPEPTALPGFLVAILLSAPATKLQFGPELLALTLLLLLVRVGLALTLSARPRPSQLLFFGGLAVLPVLTDPQVSLMAGAIVIVLLMGEGSSLKRMFTVLGGCLLLLLTACLGLAAVGSLDGFGELVTEGVRHAILGNDVAQPINDGALLSAVFGLLLLMSVIGVWQTRAKDSGTTAKGRLAESVLAVWFAAGLLEVVVRLPELNLSTVQLCGPPIAVYSSYWLLLGPARRQLGLQLVAICVLMGLPFAAPALRTLPGTWISVWPLNQYLGPAPDLSLLALRSSLNSYPQSIQVWVLAPQPAAYLALGRKPATRYIDISLYDQRVANQLSIDAVDGVPAPAIEDLFRTLRDDPPPLILDQGGRFEQLGNTLPLIASLYKRREVATWVVYERLKQ
jgi:hypothetical protein